MNGMLSENVSLTSTTSGTWTYASTAVNGNSTGKIKNNVYGTNKSNWILTPMIDLGESGDLYELSFDLALTDYNYPNNPPDAAPDDKFAVVVSEDGEIVVVNRGNKGAAVINFSLEENKVEIATNLPDGEYKDKVYGKVFKVENGILTGTACPETTYILG